MKLPRRAGFSLFEVLVSTAILMVSAVVLFQLASLGTRHANSAQALAEAQWICQAKLQEMLSGMRPVERVENELLADKPGWVYSVELEPVDEPAHSVVPGTGTTDGTPADLAVLRVTVAEDVEEEDQRRVQFTLTRWIRDPHLASDADSESTWPAEGAPEGLLDEGELP